KPPCMRRRTTRAACSTAGAACISGAAPPRLRACVYSRTATRRTSGQQTAGLPSWASTRFNPSPPAVRGVSTAHSNALLGTLDNLWRATMHLKLLLLGYLFIALILGMNTAQALRTEVVTLGDMVTPT